MESEGRRRIEETVMEILKKTNMEEMTEYKVRAMASKRLGVDLSETECKKLVRNVVENFLISSITEESEGKEAEPNHSDENKEVVQQKPEIRPKKVANEDGDRVICKLSNRRKVVIHDFRGKSWVSIRDYFERDGKLRPTGKGVTLSTEHWSVFRRNVPAIEEAIKQMTSRLRTEVDGDRVEDDSDPITDFVPQELVRVETTRFDGKNYHCWAQLMDLFLQQLKVAYVLTDPCPSATLGPEASTKEFTQAKAAEQKWINDDYVCRHNILSSLSDNLFHQYSKKTINAKELWEELKLVYLYEEFGTKRAQVKKYVEFEMVEGKPVLEQIQEFNGIADSIVAAGMLIDEKFHVSVIISKLPPSWKDVCIKLMREDYLPFWILMDHLRVEEELRNQEKLGLLSNPVGHHSTRNYAPNTRDMKLRDQHVKKRDWEMDSKSIVCYACGKRGHMSRNCHSKKAGNEIIQGKKDGDNVPLPANPEINVVDSTE